jgi:hypothetical protein
MSETSMSDHDVNQTVAEQICTNYALNGQKFRLGEWVALLDGKVVAVAIDLETALRALRAIDPDPKHGMLVEVGPPAVDVIV